MDSTVQDRIRQQVTETPVVLFMKGTPVFPQCGFSAAVVRWARGLAAGNCQYSDSPTSCCVQPPADARSQVRAASDTHPLSLSLALNPDGGGLSLVPTIDRRSCVDVGSQLPRVAVVAPR